jgi:hypothetical protein
MTPRRRAKIEAFDQVPETCPKVYDAMNEATAKVVRETKALRVALVRALERAHRAEERLQRLSRKAGASPG